MADGAPSALFDEDYCYLTTTGRRSGNPHTIEIWFAVIGRTLYMLRGNGEEMPSAGASERADWVRNIQRDPAVHLRIRNEHFDATARIVTGGDEDAAARAAVAGKYRARGYADLDDWERDGLVVAVDLTRSAL